ncbi:glycosyltransferase [Micromonospora sp. NPDC005553]|uniref:glycosyltransferase n=1 Tax=unclassified Micromonospora TaxID=2617518 RepID=UPI00339FD1AD
MLNRVVVVVPAHDEQALLPDCLSALQAALHDQPVRTELIVVADQCRDDTAAIAEQAGATVVEVAARNVGAARAAGFAHALRGGARGLWLATTDADSRVPRDWIDWHRHHARRGTDILAGTVTVTDWTPRGRWVRDRYEKRYRSGLHGSDHTHVHGANLGCTASAYADLDGFAPLAHGEDHDLVFRGRQAGLRVVADASCPVDTSARHHSRAPAGFARYLDTYDESRALPATLTPTQMA